MKEILCKSYDILKEEQRNADNKAYIFIGLLTAVIGIFGEVPVNGLGDNGMETLMQMLLFLLVPLFLLIYSLIPRYNAKLFLGEKEKNPEPFNIYYWKTIVQLKDKSEFISKIEDKYKKELIEDEVDLVCQIYANVKIMSTKASLHILAFSILTHIVVFFLSSFLFLAFGLDKHIWFFVIWFLLEFLYWLVPFLKNRESKTDKFEDKTGDLIEDTIQNENSKVPHV